ANPPKRRRYASARAGSRLAKARRVARPSRRAARAWKGANRPHPTTHRPSGSEPGRGRSGRAGGAPPTCGGALARPCYAPYRGRATSDTIEAMRRVAVVGVGITKFGKHERTCAELFAEAAVEALTDGGIRPREIQGVYVGNVVGEAAERQLHLGPQV